MEAFEQDIQNCLSALHSGGIILYPTDTIWGLGCDATDESAVQKIYALKQRAETKSMIVLMTDEREVLRWVAAPDLAVFDFIKDQQRPTTVVFEGAIGLAPNLIAPDGSVGIRLVQDAFCRHLIKRFRKPIVSTSANRSGEPPALLFRDIVPDIKSGADYTVGWRRDDAAPAQPSQIMRWKAGQAEWIRR
jgi:L-threonylcarbamoyladenylate synthase